ncbi:MAG: cytidylate kinase-like family protein [Bacteroidota bacterium]|nr:cytidylate kinase-like family protein [Bacteroidota bacterium]
MNNPGIIINVGRQIGAGGNRIAKFLAKEFSCKFYDKELLNLAAKESGFCERFFEQNDEHKKFFKTLFHVHVPLLGDNNFYKNNFGQESLYQFQCEAIRKAAAAGDCVFVGRTADYVLREYTNTFNLFVCASLEDRIDRVSERKNIDRAAAERFLRCEEEERASYYNYYTGKRWGHADSYDLCVNTSVLGIEKTEQFIANFIRQRFGLTETVKP